MSKAVQAIRNFFGIPHKPKSCWDDFHAATERVAEKTKKILEDRNDFHHSVKRMKTRKRK